MTVNTQYICINNKLENFLDKYTNHLENVKHSGRPSLLNMLNIFTMIPYYALGQICSCLNVKVANSLERTTNTKEGQFVIDYAF